MNKRLPLIPLSPLINTSSEYAKLLAETTQSLTDDNTPIVKSNLEKTMIKEREKLDRLLKNMQVIQNSIISNFSINEIAQEIAYINCSLFRMVTINEQWLSTFDKQSNIVPLLDFHRYISHSFAHQVIMNCEAIKSIKKPNSIIGDLIQIVYILVYIYRDFSGSTAILTALHMPEIQRLESVWKLCPPKLLNTYKDLVLMISPQNQYGAYFQQLSALVSPFLNTIPSKSQMIAVPFMHAHLQQQQQVAVLEFCQQYSQIDPAEFLEYRVSSKRKSKRASTIRLSMSPCLDLEQIRSNPSIYHWLVSRVYLDRNQLHLESLHVEPLAVGEIELEPEEEHDFFWDFYSMEPETIDDTTNKEPSISEEPVEIPQKRNSSTQTMPPAEIPTDSDMVILDESEEEEWTGYPHGSDDDSDSEEEWTGYPIQDDEEDEEQEEDEEEIWKGYPKPPTPPPYTNVIGKAAARRMQYSVSDTNRKRLPSPFAPSTST